MRTLRQKDLEKIYRGFEKDETKHIGWCLPLFKEYKGVGIIYIKDKKEAYTKAIELLKRNNKGEVNLLCLAMIGFTVLFLIAVFIMF